MKEQVYDQLVAVSAELPQEATHLSLVFLCLFTVYLLTAPVLLSFDVTCSRTDNTATAGVMKLKMFFACLFPCNDICQIYHLLQQELMPSNKDQWLGIYFLKFSSKDL